MSGAEFSELELLLRLEYPIYGRNTLVDVGAHTGGFVRPFADRGWRVIAFEPEPANYKDLSANFRACPNVTCIAKAVSDTSEEGIPFYVSSEHWGIHSLKPFHSTHCRALMVETIRLDKALADMGLDEVTILKIDVEGADFLALRSFDFNRLHPFVVVCEFMDDRSRPYFGYTHDDMAAYMTDLDYVTFVSEWAPIKEYARKDMPSEPHVWLQCAKYPLNHKPAWGNLIFVSSRYRDEFAATLDSYLCHVRRLGRAVRIRNRVGTIFRLEAIWRLLLKRCWPSNQ